MKRLALDEGESASQGNRPLNWDILANLLIPQKRPDMVEDSTTKVMVVRTKPDERCAIIGPFHVTISNDIDLEYLVFPYVE